MRIRVAAVIVHDGRVLLVSTKKGPSGYFVPPGGGVEEGTQNESVTAAVERETHEETGLYIQAGKLLGWRQFSSGRGPTLELYFAAALQEATQSSSPEGRVVLWAPVKELAQIPHFPAELATLCALAESGQGALALSPDRLEAPQPPSAGGDAL